MNWRFWLVLGFAGLLWSGRAEGDPIEGKWLGQAGPSQDRVELGFEFKRGEKGQLEVFLYQSVINFYGLKLPGVLVREGDTYSLPEAALSLKLLEGRLEGTYLTPKTPVSLQRAQSLPAEVPVPELPQGPGPRWRTKLGGAIYAPAALRDGVAYVGTTGGVFNAIRVEDGAFVWTFVAGRPIHGEALATEEHLYFVCDNGYLFKLDRKTGKEIWRYDLGDERVSRPLPHPVLDQQGIGEFDFDGGAPRPLLADGAIYVGSGDGSFHAVDSSTGQRLWRFEGQGKIRASAVLDGSRVVFGSFGGVAFSLDRKSGKEIWRKETHADITGEPVLLDDVLILGNRGGLLAGLSPATGEVLWRLVFWGSAVESTPVPGEGSLFYIGSSDLRRISKVDARDGRVLWRTDVFGVPWARPAVTDELVFAAAVGVEPYEIRHLGGLSALDRATGEILWRWPTPASASLHNGFAAGPAISGNTLVIGGLDGNLYGFAAGKD